MAKVFNVINVVKKQSDCKDSFIMVTSQLQQTVILVKIANAVVLFSQYA